MLGSLGNVGLKVATIFLLATVVIAFPGAKASPERPQKPTGPPTKVPPCAALPDDAQTMFVPLGHAQFFGDGELLINNRGLKERAVETVWYVQGQGRVSGRTFAAPASHMGFYSLRDFLPPNVQIQSVSGLEINYVAHSREIWAQVVLRPDANSGLSQSIDAPFQLKTDFKSSRLIASFPVRNQTTRAAVALANTTSQEITVQVAGLDGVDSVSLHPYQGRVLRANNLKKEQGSLRITLTSSAPPGSLRASGITFTGSTALLTRFFDPAMAIQEDLFTSGIEAGNRQVTVSVSNTTSESIFASTLVLRSDTGLPVMTLPWFELRPNATKQMDIDLAQLPQDVRVVSIKVDGDGAPGSLVGTVHLIDRSTGLSAEVRLRDSAGSRASTGGYPWRLTGDFSTKIHITNVGDIANRVSARVQLGELKYILRSGVIPVGGTVTFDIRRLRDSQTPDPYGTVIPLDANEGQFYWSAYDNRPGTHFSGRSEITNVAEGISSTFSCDMCCENSLVNYWLTAESYDIAVGIDTALYPERQMMDCNGYDWWEPAYPDIGSFSFNPSLIQVNEDGIGHYWVTALDEGDPSVTLNVGGDFWTYVPPATYEEIDRCDWSAADFDPSTDFHSTVAVPQTMTLQGLSGTNGATDPGNGILKLPMLVAQYTWTSSTGPQKLTDLANCEIWERLNYVTWPIPPFHPHEDSTDHFMTAASNGTFPGSVNPGDAHLTDGPLANSLLVVVAGTARVDQTYGYKCNGGGFTAMTGPNAGPHAITRTVTATNPGAANQAWSFSISKHGGSPSPSCGLRVPGVSFSGWCQ